MVLPIALLLSACLPAGKPVEPVLIDPVELQAFVAALSPAEQRACR
jgi:hypothetical protein